MVFCGCRNSNSDRHNNVRKTSLALYVNGEFVGEHLPPQNISCPTSTVVPLYFWLAPDGAHDFETNSYLNEISLLGSHGAQYMDLQVVGTHCTGNELACGGVECLNDEGCGPSCHCTVNIDPIIVDRGSLPGQCVPNECGNGVLDLPFEQCDDGNFINDDGCNNSCLLPEDDDLGCVIKTHDLRNIDSLVALLTELISNAEGDELQQLIELRDALLDIKDKLVHGTAVGPIDGFDNSGRFCAGTCHESPTECTAVWGELEGDFVLQDCLCGDVPNPELCQIHVAPTPSAIPIGAPADGFNRYCAGSCPFNDNHHCDGEFREVERGGVLRTLLLRCGCRDQHSCLIDFSAGQGTGDCFGECTYFAQRGSSSPSFCVALFEEDSFTGCGCQHTDPACGLRFVEDGGFNVCSGGCPYGHCTPTLFDHLTAQPLACGCTVIVPP